MSSQPLGPGRRPTCEVLIRVTLLSMFPSFPGAFANLPANLPHDNTICIPAGFKGIAYAWFAADSVVEEA
jgi:hypothetical protein